MWYRERDSYSEIDRDSVCTCKGMKDIEIVCVCMRERERET